MKAKTIHAVLAAMVLASGYAFAQGGPPGRGGFGQGGFGGPPQGPGGFRGGMMMGPGAGGAGILMRPDVRKELKLSEDQADKIDALLRPGGQGFGGRGGGGDFGGPPGGRQGGGFGGGQGGPPGRGQGGGFSGGQGGPPQGGPPQGGPGGGFGPGGPGGFDPQQMEKREKELDQKVKAILSESQYTRFHELALQLDGAQALQRKDVADKVGLSQEKREQIAEIVRKSMEANRPDFGGQRGGLGDPDEMRRRMEEMRAKMEKSRKDMNAKILAALSDAEKSKWKAMLGKEFNFEEMRMGPPPGSPGGL
ncbi:MAG: hypothetical protein HZC36_09520 [Armatimonadetes bacterium]|nr:hypothetical protein [Armatimonadota bacterium]